MKNRFLLFLLIAVVLTMGISAAETVAVNSSTNFQAAVLALKGQGGTITLEEDATLSSDIKIPEQAGDITITGKTLTLAGDIEFAKSTNGNTITFDLPVKVNRSAKILGGFNNICFTKNFSVEGDLDFYGGVNTYETEDGTVQENNAMELKMNEEAVALSPYSIKVDGGTFRVFAGGNYRASYSAMLGSIAAPIDITINGGTFGSGVSFDADTALKLDGAFSISGMSVLADNATLTINGGTFNSPIYAQGYLGQTSVRTSGDSQFTNSDAKYYAADGNVTINIKGGTFNCCEISATQRAASYSQLLRGNYTLTIDKKAKLADGIVLDATQVKAYADKSEKAALTYPAGAKVTVKRFDVVNGKAEKYDEPLRIAFIGDSITQGSNAYIGKELSYEKKSYPAQLLEKMVANGHDVVVSNYGCSATKIINYTNFGYTLGLAYTISMKETDADYVVVALGTNDSLACTYTYGMKDRFSEEYYDFISGYEALPDTDMVYGTCAIYRESRDVAAVAVRALQEKVFEKLVAEGKKCTYIDLYALLLESALGNNLLSSDQLHPHADGYTIYADRIYDALVNKVCSVENFEMTDIYVNSRAKLTGAGTKEDPTASISVAFGKAAKEATVHISGQYSYTGLDDSDCGFIIPAGIDKLTIVGEGEGATLRINSKYIFINCDVTFDNITIESSASPLHFVAGYNNVTFTESFKCNGAVVVAGMVTYNDVKTNEKYNSLESISSDKDCVINVNGGSYNAIVGGNLKFSNSLTLLGTYGGNLTLNIGKNVTVTDKEVTSSASGQNYLTGTVTVNADKTVFKDGLRESAVLISGRESGGVDVAKNTGKVKANGGVKLIPAGDFNSDGKVSVFDALTMLRAIADKTQSKYVKSFYGHANFFTEDNAKMLLAKAVQ